MDLFKHKNVCPACGYQFDNHLDFNDHMTNIHPETKICPKCSGTVYWEHMRGFNFMFNYICTKCGFVVETWRCVDTVFPSKEYLKKGNRSKKSY